MDLGDCVMQLRRRNPSTTSPITCMAITPDGALCLTGDDAGRLTWWELQKGGMVRMVQAHVGR